MASAWGNSWSNAWGVSWNTGVTPPTPDIELLGGGPGYKPYAKLREEYLEAQREEKRTAEALERLRAEQAAAELALAQEIKDQEAFNALTQELLQLKIMIAHAVSLLIERQRQLAALRNRQAMLVLSLACPFTRFIDATQI